MLAYISRRLIFAVFLVFAVSSASLVLTRLAGGDYVMESLGVGAHAETIEQARARYGLDKSIGAQYGDWLRRVVRLDLGRSFLYDRPVSDLIPERAANTRSRR
jgi:peptide/nickel transport system permease protein